MQLLKTYGIKLALAGALVLVVLLFATLDQTGAQDANSEPVQLFEGNSPVLDSPAPRANEHIASTFRSLDQRWMVWFQAKENLSRLPCLMVR